TRGEVYDPRSNRRTPIALKGSPLWSRDGRLYAYSLFPKSVRASQPGGEPGPAGVWVAALGGEPRLLFNGWVIWYTWSGAGEMIVLEGHANLKGTLWRVGLDGRRAEVLADVPLRLSYVLDQTNAPTVRFDVRADGRP